MLLLAIFLGLVFAYSLAARRLERTVLTAPLLFAVAGVVVVLLLPELARDRGDLGFFRRLAEIGLVLLLFTDASRTDLRLLKGTRGLPERLLSLGLLQIARRRRSLRTSIVRGAMRAPRRSSPVFECESE